MSQSIEPTRREFVAGALAAAVARVPVATGAQSGAGIPLRPLGKTGVKVSSLGLGGYHIGTVKEDDEAVRIMHAAIDEGITFFDNAWDYHNGRSEELMGKALAGRRDKVFLMTKVCGRDRKMARSNLEDSLRRLKTDHIDLWQFHEVVYDNDPDWIFERGAIDVAVEARKAGKVRFIGFTGHKDPRIHLKMLSKDFAWDASQMPLNALDAHYRSFAKQVLPVLVQRGIGPVAMKSLASGPIHTKVGVPVKEAMRYTLSLPVSTVVSGIRTMEQMKENASIARTFQPMSDQEKAVLLEKVKPVAGDGRYEGFKSTQNYDGPVHRKQHGFS